MHKHNVSAKDLLPGDRIIEKGGNKEVSAVEINPRGCRGNVHVGIKKVPTRCYYRDAPLFVERDGCDCSQDEADMIDPAVILKNLLTAIDKANEVENQRRNERRAIAVNGAY